MTDENPSQHVDKVFNHIVRCLHSYMSQEEIIQTLSGEPNMDRGVIEAVWQRLEKENEEFFRTYHLMRTVKEQITQFNTLLQKQATLMNQMQHGVSSAPMSNPSHMPPMHQSEVCYTPEIFGPDSMTMQNHVTMTNIPGPFTNYGSSSIPMGMRSTIDMPAHSGVAPNILGPHNSNVGMGAGMNGGMMNLDGGYGSRFMHGPGNSVLETRTANGDAFASSSRNAGSSSQLMNETLFSFGERDLTCSDLTADFGNIGMEFYPPREDLPKSLGHGRGV